MKQQYPKDFIKLWVSQMVTNNAFIQDRRVTGELVGDAADGNLEALKTLLEVYSNFIDQPVPQEAFGIAPDSPDRKQREMRTVIPVAERESSIRDFNELIDKGEIEII